MSSADDRVNLSHLAVVVKFNRPPWWDQARCKDTEPEKWFPQRERGVSVPKIYEVLRTVCQACPVRWECLEDNLNEGFGYFAGTTPQDRLEIDVHVRLKTKETLKAYAESVIDRRSYLGRGRNIVKLGSEPERIRPRETSTENAKAG